MLSSIQYPAPGILPLTQSHPLPIHSNGLFISEHTILLPPSSQPPSSFQSLNSIHVSNTPLGVVTIVQSQNSLIVHSSCVNSEQSSKSPPSSLSSANKHSDSAQIQYSNSLQSSSSNVSQSISFSSSKSEGSKQPSSSSHSQPI